LFLIFNRSLTLEEISALSNCTGDFNGDLKVDYGDFKILENNWLKTGCGDPNWCDGSDLNQDAVVDFHDFLIFRDCWLKACAV
jgi:hypothetical protein